MFFSECWAIELDSLSRIGDTALFRGNPIDREKRLLLLGNTKHLKSPENYKSVYIRDLTYQQRQEMILRSDLLRLVRGLLEIGVLM